jgi:plasmid stabilization system protein ParE
VAKAWRPWASRHHRIRTGVVKSRSRHAVVPRGGDAGAGIHPQVGTGRPGAPGRRELVIGRGVQGYVARDGYDEVEDLVVVVALRAQRERGFGVR